VVIRVCGFFLFLLIRETCDLCISRVADPIRYTQEGAYLPTLIIRLEGEETILGPIYKVIQIVTVL